MPFPGAEGEEDIHVEPEWPVFDIVELGFVVLFGVGFACSLLMGGACFGAAVSYISLAHGGNVDVRSKDSACILPLKLNRGDSLRLLWS